jgi:quinol monooxygenase YgiN
MIKSTIRMTISSPKIPAVMAILKPVIELCRDDPGCLSCHLYEDLQEKSVIMLEEAWRTEDDLNLHLRSDEYRNLLLAVELALKRPEIRFDTVSSTAGIEIIEKARGEAR